jgi:hypothetical protein
LIGKFALKNEKRNHACVIDAQGFWGLVKLTYHKLISSSEGILKFESGECQEPIHEAFTTSVDFVPPNSVCWFAGLQLKIHVDSNRLVAAVASCKGYE